MIILPVTIDKLNTLKDGSVKITVETMELTPEKAGQVFSLINQHGYMAFKKEQFQDNDKEIMKSIKADIDPLEKTKSQAQRIRSVLFRVWEKEPEGYKEFNDYYKLKTNIIINHFKNQIPV